MRLPGLNSFGYNALETRDMHDFEFYAPRTWQEAFCILDVEGAQVIAGGTDLIPLLRCQQAQPRHLVDLQRLVDLRYIRRDNGLVQIGAMTTHADLARSQICANCAPLLSQAALSVGSPQIRNRGTIGGNIATASPAGDTLPPLLALDALVVLASRRGERHVPLQEILSGPGTTTMEGDEILARIEFPCPLEGTSSAFAKVGRRNAVAISVASMAVVLHMEDRLVHDVRIAAGAVAPTALRCTAAERILEGSPLNDDSLLTAAEAVQAEIEPITDLRASSSYRRLAAGALLKRAVRQAAHLSTTRPNNLVRD